MNLQRFSAKSRKLAMLAAVFTVAPLVAVVGIAHAAITTASLTISDPRPYTGTGGIGSAASYDFKGTNFTGTIQCVQLKFTVNSDGTGGVPNGFDSATSAAVNTGQSDLFSSHTGFTLDKTTNGTLKYTHATGVAPSGAGAVHFVVDNIQNGNTASNDYYLTVTTYSNSNCSTGLIDTSVVGFIYTEGQQVSLTVDGSLAFTVAGVTGNGSLAVNGNTVTNGLATTSNTIPFSTLTSTTNKTAAQDLTVSTNSPTGYTVYTKYTGLPTSGSFTISDLLTHTNASPGTFSGNGVEAFGYTTEDSTLSNSPNAQDRFTSSGGNKWAAFTTSNNEVAYNNAPIANQTTRVGFQAGISPVTEPGAYTTTVIYTAVPVY